MTDAKSHGIPAERGVNVLAFLITFTAYGTWLHGDRRGSVDRAHNAHGGPVVSENPERQSLSRQAQMVPEGEFDTAKRLVVQQAIQGVCDHNGWTLRALNVRTNHVHVVVSIGAVPPEVAMNHFKAWSTRRLREAGLMGASAKVWTRHGSTRYLWTEDQITHACHYVVHGQ